MNRNNEEQRTKSSTKKNIRKTRPKKTSSNPTKLVKEAQKLVSNKSRYPNTNRSSPNIPDDKKSTKRHRIRESPKRKFIYSLNAKSGGKSMNKSGYLPTGVSVKDSPMTQGGKFGRPKNGTNNNINNNKTSIYTHTFTHKATSIKTKKPSRMFVFGDKEQIGGKDLQAGLREMVEMSGGSSGGLFQKIKNSIKSPAENESKFKRGCAEQGEAHDHDFLYPKHRKRKVSTRLLPLDNLHNLNSSPALPHGRRDEKDEERDGGAQQPLKFTKLYTIGHKVEHPLEKSRVEKGTLRVPKFEVRTKSLQVDTERERESKNEKKKSKKKRKKVRRSVIKGHRFC